jgi:hypothetical protein
MTDSYAEKVILENFLDIPSVSDKARCYCYWQEKEQELIDYFVDKPFVIEGFDDFYVTTVDEFYSWYTSYPDYPDWKSEENDVIYNAVVEKKLTVEDKFDTNGMLKSELFPTVALQNVSFNKPEDGYWYEFWFIPSKPIEGEIFKDARQRWIGIVQINICTPSNVGTKPAKDRYDEIVNKFKCGKIFEGVRIDRTYQERGQEDEDYYLLPVTIAWKSDIEK